MRGLGRTDRSTLSRDVIAGLTGAVAGAPQAMAFAILAGVSPVYGLYAAFAPTIIGALFSNSGLMTIAPTNVLMLLVANALAGFGNPDPPFPLFTLTLMVGLIQLAFGALRLGALSRFVSNAVIVGFISGAGVLIILGQLHHITGYSLTSSGNALERSARWLALIPATQIAPLLVGLTTMGVIVGLRRTRYKLIATLIGIGAASILASLLQSPSIALVRDLSHIPSQLPSLVLPNLEYAPALFSSAFALAVLASIQSAALAESIHQPGQRTPDFSRDLLAQGIANAVGGFFQCLPASGSLSRTAVSISAGARTRLANLLAGAFIGGILLLFAGLIEHIPLAALAGQLIVAATSLIDWPAIRGVWRISLSSRAAMLITFGCTLVLPLEYSIYIGISLTLGIYLLQSLERLHAVRLEPLESGDFRETPLPVTLVPGEPVIISVSGHLYFAAAKRLEELLPAPEGIRQPIVILRMRDNAFLGSTGVRIMQHYAERLQAQGGQLILSGVGAPVYAELQHAGLVAPAGQIQVFAADDVIFSATRKALVYARNLSQPDEPHAQAAALQLSGAASGAVSDGLLHRQLR
ncbi:MAG: SulP family inorganic anion transporter [Anaerolineae bacterium]|nr:SulP family inorganic anion transporter [Anaerolineae bacterium]